MKKYFIPLVVFSYGMFSCTNKASESTAVASEPVAETTDQHYFLDVHNLEPGGVTFEDVAGAHEKDLATQDKYGVKFIKYWVDEKAGKVYCLAQASDSASVAMTHKEAHGLVPDLVHKVTHGEEAIARGGQNLFLDIHHLGPGNVTAAAVEEAHIKDLAIQEKHGVNFINYWVDEKAGVVMCLSEAKDRDAVIATHTEAHGLIPHEVHPVKQGE
jgi:hypothetical protein